MNNYTKGKIIKISGWITVGVGLYLVHKGVTMQNIIEHGKIIDIDFQVIED